MDGKLSLKGVWSESRDLFNFVEINDNVSETVQDRDIVHCCNGKLIGNRM